MAEWSIAVVLNVRQGWEGHHLLPIHPNKNKPFRPSIGMHWGQLSAVHGQKDGQRCPCQVIHRAIRLDLVPHPITPRAECRSVSLSCAETLLSHSIRMRAVV